MTTYDVHPSDMVVWILPDDLAEDDCAELGRICGRVQERYRCECDLFRKTAVQFAKTNWKQDLRALLPEPGIILDCGANTGNTIDAMRSVYPDATIFAFEPVLESYAVLEAKCANDRNAHPMRVALGNRDGVGTINLTRDLNCCSFLQHDPTAPYATQSEPVGTEDVPIARLDTWLSYAGIDASEIGILKMDLQGGELECLRGAEKLLRHVRYIFTEVMFTPLYVDAPLYDDIDRFLEARGFRRRAMYPSMDPIAWGDALYERSGDP